MNANLTSNASRGGRRDETQCSLPFIHREFGPGWASEMPPAPVFVVQMLVIFALAGLNSDVGHLVGWVCFVVSIIVAWRYRVSPWSIIGGGSGDDLHKLYNCGGARLND